MGRVSATNKGTHNPHTRKYTVRQSGNLAAAIDFARIRAGAALHVAMNNDCTHVASTLNGSAAVSRAADQGATQGNVAELTPDANRPRILNSSSPNTATDKKRPKVVGAGNIPALRAITAEQCSPQRD